MAKATKKRTRRPRYQSTDSLVEAIGTRSLDALNELADKLKAKHPWGASFLAARLKAPAKPALPPDVPVTFMSEQATGDEEPPMPETPVMLDHATRADMINKEAGL